MYDIFFASPTIALQPPTSFFGKLEFCASKCIPKTTIWLQVISGLRCKRTMQNRHMTLALVRNVTKQYTLDCQQYYLFFVGFMYVWIFLCCHILLLQIIITMLVSQKLVSLKSTSYTHDYIAFQETSTHELDCIPLSFY